MTQPSAADWSRIGVLSVIWGGSFLFTGIAVRDIEPLTVAAGRIAIGAALLALAAALSGGRFIRDPRALGFAVGAGILSNAAPFALLSWALQTVPSGVAAVFMAALPLVVALLSHWLIAGERLTPRRMIGVALGLVGVMILIGPKALSSMAALRFDHDGEALPMLACLGATFCYALGSILLKRAPKTHPLSFGATSLAAGAALILPVAFIAEAPLSMTPGAPSLLALLALAAFPTAAALMIMLKVLENNGPPFLSLVNYLVPIWGVIFGAIFAQEALSPRLGLALVLILGGLAIGQRRPKRPVQGYLP